MDKQIADLITCLQESKFHRSRAAKNLGELGPVAAPAVPALIEALKDKDQDVRYYAVDALGHIGRASVAAIPVLTTRLQDADCRVRVQAAVALREIDKNSTSVIVPVLVHALTCENRFCLIEAAHALLKIGMSSSAITLALTECVQPLDGYDYSESEFRGRAATLLGENRQSDPAAISALIQMLDKRILGESSSAAIALGRIGRSDPTAISSLVNALKHGDVVLRGYAAKAIGEICSQDENLMQILVESMDEKDDENRFDIVQGLINVKQAMPIVVSALHAALTDRYIPIVTAAAEALLRIDPSHASAISALMHVINIKEPWAYGEVRIAAAAVLWKFGHADNFIKSAIVENIDNAPSSRSVKAAEAMGEISQIDSSVIPVLARGLRRDDSDIRKSVVEILGKIGKTDKASVPFIVAALRDVDLSIRIIASRALEDIGPDAASAIPDLIDGLNNPSCFYEFACTLRSLGGVAIDGLVEFLRRGEPIRGEFAARALLMMGDDGIARLRELVEDENQVICRTAAQALMDSGFRLKSILAAQQDKIDPEELETRSQADKVLTHICILYLLGCAFREGRHSINDAVKKLLEYHTTDMILDEIPLTKQSFHNNLEHMGFRKLVCRLVNTKIENVRLTNVILINKKKVSRFSDQAWLVWEWADSFLRTKKLPDWWGFLPLFPKERDTV